jgi:hypothetical protein
MTHVELKVPMVICPDSRQALEATENIPLDVREAITKTWLMLASGLYHLETTRYPN